ncbi:MAG: chemotaxis protein CheW [Microvirga sp.]
MDGARAPADDERVLVVRVGDTYFGLPGAAILEVIRDPVLTRVPLAPPSLAGLANLRGVVLPVVSLAALTGLLDASGPPGGRVVVLDHGGPLGLAVDAVASYGALDDGATQDGQPVRLFALDALLARDFDDRTRRGRAQAGPGAPARPPEAAPAAPDRILVAFAVAGQDYALPLDRTREIVSAAAGITAVPRSDPAMAGIVARRGRTLPLVLARAVLGLPPAPDTDRPRTIIVMRMAGQDGRPGAGPRGGQGGGQEGGQMAEVEVGLVVDAVKDILRVPESLIDPVPALLTRGGEAEIAGICRLEGGRRLVSLLAPDGLLRGLEDVLAAGAAPESESAEMIATTAQQFLVFRLGGQDYGLPAAAVEEVVRLPDALTPVPRAPAFVEGVMNLRGRIVPVIDQRRRFALADGAGRRARVIVVDVDGAPAGFIVDAASEILSVPDERIRATPELAAGEDAVIDRIATLDADGRMILLIDPRALLDRAERDLLQAMADPERPVP